MTSDGVKKAMSGKKYSDFVLHYIDVNKKSSQATLQSIFLYVMSHSEAESAEAICNPLDQMVRVIYGVSFWSFMKHMTLVMDCAANMPRILNASVSTCLVLLSERWMRCFIHQLNIPIKHVVHILTKQDDWSAIAMDMGLVKEVVTAIEQASILPPPGYSLMQECETRFGTTNNVIQRILKSAHLVHDINNEEI